MSSFVAMSWSYTRNCSRICLSSIMSQLYLHGRGLFNYRMVWPCKYNCDMIEDKQMRLQFRVYDHDIATKDDMIGEAQIDLQPVLKAAFVHKERNTLLRIAEPWRIQDMLTSWKAFLFLRKDGHKVGELIVSLDVY